MTKDKRFIIDVGEPQHENAFFEYDEHFDDYDFVCWEDDFDEILKKFNELGNENEQLKKDRNELFIRERDAKNNCRKLKYENEQLQEKLKIYHKIANCQNCYYHNYDWYDDGNYDEFEVCDKGNDVTEGICEEWREL